MTPPLRNASSRRRCASVSKLNSVVSKICVSGLKVTFVPRFFVVPVTSSSAGRRAALVALLVDLAVAPDLELERLRQRVDDRDADAVQAARDLVAVVVELAAGVQHGQHDFGGRLAARVPVDRDAAAVVDDGDRVVDVDRDVDLIAEAGQRLVDRVVDDLVDEVMQPGGPGRADVHRRPLADRLEAFEDLDLVGAVVVGAAVCRCAVDAGVSTQSRRLRRRRLRVVAVRSRVVRFRHVSRRSDSHRHDDVGVVVALGADRLHHRLAHFVLQLERDDVGLDRRRGNRARTAR